MTRVVKSIESEPWLFWSPLVREEVALKLTGLIMETRMQGEALAWHEFPALRSHAEDVTRALEEIRKIVSITNLDTGTVPMGEEAAP